MKPAIVLKKCLLAGGKVLAKYFGKVGYSLKGHANLLTKADIDSQRAILKIIKANFPSHDYLAEENQIKQTSSQYIWVIDPLDGTTNYAHSYPVACVSVGLIKDGKPFLGGIFDPFRNELFFAQRGQGATLNDKKIKVSQTKKLADSLLLTGFPYDRAKKPGYYCAFYEDFVQKCHDIRRSGSAALDMAYVAAGRIDGFWEFKLNPWDVCAGFLIVEEAGGKVTDFSGRSWKAAQNYGSQTLATNAKIHPEMLETIKKLL
ncbi:MAG: inositol monophosphatase family protein [Elusimicrobia bacterium]|nr:inositol monophosphatase family protein [Elusimicrobiota bacterium]